MNDLNIADLIHERVDAIDIDELVKLEVRRVVASTVTRLVTQKILAITDEVAKGMVVDEINSILGSEVMVDDGWGHRAKYDTFDDLFKESLKKAAFDSYKVKQITNDVVKRMSQEYVQEKAKEIDSIVREALAKQVKNETT